MYNDEGVYFPPILCLSRSKTTDEKLGKKSKKKAQNFYNLLDPDELDAAIAQDEGASTHRGRPSADDRSPIWRKVPNYLVELLPKGTVIVWTPNGSMLKEHWVELFELGVRPWLSPHDKDHPIIFGCDNHSTHQDDTSYWEKDTWNRGEYIVNIASLTSKFTQPNDSDNGPNHKFKPLYTREIIDIMEAKIDSGDTYMTCIDMVEAFSRAFPKMKPTWASGSFYDSGVFRRRVIHPDEGAPPGVVRRVYAEPAVLHGALKERGWQQQEDEDGNLIWVNRHQESENNPTRRDLEICPEDAAAVQLAKDRLLE